MKLASFSSVVLVSLVLGCAGESAQTSAQSGGANVQGVACTTERQEYPWNAALKVSYDVLRVGDASFSVKVFARNANVVGVDPGAKEPPDTRMSWGQLTLVKSAESSDYTSTTNRRLAILEKKPGEFTLVHKMQDSDTTPKVSAALTCLSSPTSVSGLPPPHSGGGNPTGEPSPEEYRALKACLASVGCAQEGCEVAALTETTKKYCVSSGTTLVSVDLPRLRCGGGGLTLSGYKNASGKEFDDTKLSEMPLSLALGGCGTPSVYHNEVEVAR